MATDVKTSSISVRSDRGVESVFLQAEFEECHFVNFENGQLVPATPGLHPGLTLRYKTEEGKVVDIYKGFSDKEPFKTFEMQKTCDHVSCPLCSSRLRADAISSCILVECAYMIQGKRQDHRMFADQESEVPSGQALVFNNENDNDMTEWEELFMKINHVKDKSSPLEDEDPSIHVLVVNNKNDNDVIEGKDELMKNNHVKNQFDPVKDKPSVFIAMAIASFVAACYLIKKG